jgi:hypothetical protein
MTRTPQDPETYKIIRRYFDESKPAQVIYELVQGEK